MSQANEYLIDGVVVNKLLEQYNLEAILPTAQLHHMLPGQVFDTIEKKLIKSISDEIDKAQPQSVRFVNLEEIATGPHKDYIYAICGGLRQLADALKAKKIQVSGQIQNPWILPWSLVAKIDPTFKGLPAPGETTSP
jgi:hypothetical protein